MDTREGQIYASLLKARHDIKAAYYDNLRNLRHTKAPTEVVDRLWEESIEIINKLTRMIEGHPLHRFDE